MLLAFALFLATRCLSSDRVPPDTIKVIRPDTTRVDSLSNAPEVKKISKLSSKVEYLAADSIRFNIDSKTVYMYRSNDLQYEGTNLKADFVKIDFSSSVITATYMADSSGKKTGEPVFTEGDRSFKSKMMQYNFVTKKGLIEEVITQDGEGYLHGEKIKRQEDESINIYSGKYTTCNQEHPHFEFRYNKARVIPDNKIVTGPAFFVVEDVITPLFIPFGLFPNKKGQRSGIVIPTYGESANRGFYLENGGYYIALNDYVDFKLVGDVYSLGSWAIEPSLNYNKRYAYSGNMNFSYAVNILGEEGTRDYSKNKAFSIRWSHSQDTRSRPNSRFSANVNILSSSDYNKFNSNTSAYLSNTFQSSVNYSRSWQNKYFLNTSLNHSQNTINKTVSLTLPNISFSVNRFYPFRRPVQSGKLKWYENIGVNYNFNAENKINTYDSLLFKPGFAARFQNGIKHTASVSSGSIKVLKYLVWSNSANYNERWYMSSIRKDWINDTIIINNDTVEGYVRKDTVKGFVAARDFSFSSSLGTTFYGMYTLKKGPLQAVRHVIKPSLNFSYTPDFSGQQWGYYRYYIAQSGEPDDYSIFEDGIYGSPPSRKSGVVGFRISNNIEMKIRSKSDTITGVKKVVLIEDLSISENYDLTKDSLNLSELIISGRTTLFKKLQLHYSGSFDPYVLNANNKRLNKFEWTENRRLFRTNRHNWRLGVNWQLSSGSKNKDKTSANASEQELKDVQQNPDNYVDWDIPWSLNISYDINYSNQYSYTNGYQDYVILKDKKIIQTLGFNGDFSLTPKWKFGFRSGYDFQNHDFTYTSFDIHRDLHCWQMSFNWIPMGFRKSWNFTLNIKSGMLQDLKLDKKKDFRDY